MSRIGEYDEYAIPFGEITVPHPTGQLLEGNHPELDQPPNYLDLTNEPIVSAPAARNIIRRRVVKATAVAAGVAGVATAGAIFYREQRKQKE